MKDRHFLIEHMLTNVLWSLPARDSYLSLDCAHPDHDCVATTLTKGLASNDAEEPKICIHTSRHGRRNLHEWTRRYYAMLLFKVCGDYMGGGKVVYLPDHAPIQKEK